MSDKLNLKQADISASTATGDNTIVAAATGKSVKVWQFFLVNQAGTATTLVVKDGTTALNATAIPLASTAAPNGFFLWPYTGAPWYVTTIGNALVFTIAGTSGVVTGRIYYTLE